MKITIDIAITCYNNQDFLEDCISSIKNQTYKNWRIYFCDDYSNDKSLLVLDKVCKKYRINDKIVIIRNTNNFGYGKTLKTSIESGNSKLCVVLDSDDALANNNVLKNIYLTHQNNPSISMTYSNYYLCEPNLHIYKEVRTRQIQENESYLSLLNNIKISHLKTFKRDSYNKTGGINKELRKNVDKDLTLKLEEVGKLHFIDEFMYLYRRHTNSISSLFKTSSKEYKDMVWKSKLQMIEDAKIRRKLK